MPDQRLTIGGLSLVLQIEAKASAQIKWDKAHLPFLTQSSGPPSAILSVRAGLAPQADFDEPLADARLWTLYRQSATGVLRITIHGGPVGALSMILDLEPPQDGKPLTGTLFLGPPPPGQDQVTLGYPLMPLLWTLLLGRLGGKNGGLLCHACGIVTPAGEGVLFSGFSGAGKSTTSRLWRKACPAAVILSDDRIVLRQDPSSPTGFTFYGTPWHGDAEEAHTGHAPVRQLLILGRSPDGVRSSLVPLTPATAAAQLLARTTPPIWDKSGTEAALSLAVAACQSLPIARWDFAPVLESVDNLLTALA